MDLVSRGAFDHPELWKMLRDRKQLCTDLYRRPRPYQPDAAVIVDEVSKFYVKDDWDTTYWTMYRLRDESAGCHVWASSGEVIQTDGTFLTVHSGADGVRPVTLPDGVAAEPIDADVAGREDGCIHVRFRRGDTVWFKLRREH